MAFTSPEAGTRLTLAVEVESVAPSDHAYFGEHYLVRCRVAETNGPFAEGLEFQLRQPADGSALLMSEERRAKARERAQVRAAKAAEIRKRHERRRAESDPEAHVAAALAKLDGLTKRDLVRTARDEYGVEVGSKDTRAQVIEKLREAVLASA